MEIWCHLITAERPCDCAQIPLTSVRRLSPLSEKQNKNVIRMQYMTSALLYGVKASKWSKVALALRVYDIYHPFTNTSVIRACALEDNKDANFKL